MSMGLLVTLFQSVPPIGTFIIIIILFKMSWRLNSVEKNLRSVEQNLIDINQKLNNHITDTNKEISNLKKEMYNGHEKIYTLLIDILRKDHKK